MIYWILWGRNFKVFADLLSSKNDNFPVSWNSRELSPCAINIYSVVCPFPKKLAAVSLKMAD